jgi:hypothetical protein
VTRKTLTVIFFLTVTTVGKVFAQFPGNARQKLISTRADTIVVDTLSLVPGSLKLALPSGETFALPAGWKTDEAGARIIKTEGAVPMPDSLLVVYRVFPVLLTRTWSNRERSVIEQSHSGLYNPFAYDAGQGDENFFKLEGLSRNGNISRGISFGNNQDVVVNSNFNLQLSGKLSDDVEILASITDNNIPVQPEGNTQQIQDFDKVFIQLSRNKSKLLVGDFELRKPESYFMNFFKKGQGGVFSSTYNPGSRKDEIMRTTVSAAISKGKFARKVFSGIEANQGPYRLTGADDETFITILAGSEKVFMDGVELMRGEQADYIMDYNTAEIRFTSRRPVTKDKRIVVEFQYADKNYSRTLVYLNQEYELPRFRIKGNLYSEQDAKNQPLLQDLDDEQKLLLSSVGDSLSNAYYPNIDSVEFNSTEVLYAKKDSAGYQYYVYSTDSLLAHFRLGFSFVGVNKGNYMPVTSSANGKVYEFIFPVNNIPQGSYEPVVLLIAPRKQQMVTVGADYDAGKQTRIFAEGAYSKYDVNLFSELDKENDQGYAVAGGIEKKFYLSADTAGGWKLINNIRLEHVNELFTPVEPFRNVEFNRDWNLINKDYSGNENAAGLTLAAIKKMNRIEYQFQTFHKGSDYKGYQNIAGVRAEWKKFRLSGNGSFLISSSPSEDTRFLRSATDLARLFGGMLIGARYEQERNRITGALTDSLRPNSFSFDLGKVYLISSDSAKVRYRLDFSRRYDYAVRNDDFKRSTAADEASGMLEFYRNPKSRLMISSSYRELTISDSLLTAQKPEQSLLNRAEYNGVFWQGLITLTVFYEVGSGQELKKEYAYVEVAPGTGVYTYAGDYNGNGVKDLDEFEVAAFADQANYIRVFLPTTEYVKTRTNQFNQVLNFNPAAWFKKDKPWHRTLGRFSDQLSYRTDNKTLDQDIVNSLNPFRREVDDEELLTTNTAFRNTLSFNRTSTVFGWDVTWQENRGKTILTSGFESRTLRSLVNNIRWNITKVYSLNMATEHGTKSSRSEYFSNRDFSIRFVDFEPKFGIQPGIAFRTTFVYKYQNKLNELGDAGERSEQHSGGVEFKYSSVKRGIVTARINLIHLSYNAAENTPIAYEMLEGLKKGTNYTWNVSIQRNLSNTIQVNLNYDGRKSSGVKTIHTGGVQARAFF